MAIFRLEIKPVTRSTGRSATSSAAYRAGERIRDERTGALYDHSNRRDVLHKEIILPARLDRSDAGLDWARDRATLWNVAESTEKQSNSRVAREYQAALPAELSAEQRVSLARAFSKEIADRYNVAVDLAIHEPRPGGDPRNFHAHLLATTREITPEGLGAKTGVDMAGGVRSELGLPPSRQEFVTLRERWAQLTNEALREAHIAARVDHRSLVAQGIDREPVPRIPIGAIAMERRGQRSEIAERIRERYRARVAARQAAKTAQRPEGMMNPLPGRTAERLAEGASEGSTERLVAAMAERSGGPAMDLDAEARRRQAVRDWQAYRERQVAQAERGQGEERAAALGSEKIRHQAVEAWRSLRARGAESPAPEDAAAERGDPGRSAGEPERCRDTPGLAEDLSL